jgi:hypothetical protein
LHISNEHANDINQESLSCKLFYAKNHLSKITPTIPDALSNPYGFLILEHNIESFLFFLTTAHDILFKEIDKMLSLNLRSSNINLNNIKIELEKIGQTLLPKHSRKSTNIFQSQN